MRKHLGSTAAFVLGLLTLSAGVAQPGAGALLVAGPIILVGALAYRSAKKRLLGEVASSLVRRGAETLAILLIIATVLLQRNAVQQLVLDPVPNLLIPLWAIIAYAVIAFRKPKQASE